MSTRQGALRYFAAIKNGTTPASSELSYWDGSIPWATPDDLGRLTGLTISETKRSVTKLAVEENNLNVVPPDTVLISTRAPIGHMAMTSTALTFNQGCRALVPKEGTWGPYLLYLLKSRVPELNACANGTTFVELSRDDLAGVRIALPPLETQRRIANHLDDKTAQIDALIEKKRALLDRLAEKRQAIITQVITKGLNPAAPMKDSGIEWIGRTPRHWVICGLGQKIKLQRGVDLTRDARVDGDVPVISSGGTEYFHDTALCQPPGILVGRKGSAGKLHYTTTAYWPHDTTLYVREFRGNDARFVWHLLHCLDLTSFDTGSSNPTVNRNRVHPMRTPWPPIEEQHDIASFLDATLNQSEQHEAVVDRSIDLLSEYRAALITAAVTGQIEGLR